MHPQFQCLAATLSPSHASGQVVEVGTQVDIFGMAVSDGDIIHADRHGAVVFTSDEIEKPPAAIDLIQKGKGHPRCGPQAGSTSRRCAKRWLLPSRSSSRPARYLALLPLHPGLKWPAARRPNTQGGVRFGYGVIRTTPAGRCLLIGVALNPRTNRKGLGLTEEVGPYTEAGSITWTAAAAEVASTPAIIRLASLGGHGRGPSGWVGCLLGDTAARIWSLTNTRITD